MKATRSKIVLAILCLLTILPTLEVSAQSPGHSTFYIYYSHLDSFAVKPGDHLNIGDTVGGAGTTGYMQVKNVHLHLAFGIYPPDVEAGRVDSGTSLNTDWLDPGETLSNLGASYQPGTKLCGAGFGKSNPAGGQAFHNATDHCGYSLGDPVTAVLPGTVVWTAWWPPSRQKNDTGHGQVVVEKVDLTSPLASSTEEPYVITQYADLGEFVIDTPVPTQIPQITPTPTVTGTPDQNQDFIVYAGAVVAGLLILGGVLFIASVSRKLRGFVTLLVIAIWVMCLIVGLLGYKNLTPAPSPDVQFGTGGGQMEYTWDDPALDVQIHEVLVNPPTAQEAEAKISAVFYKFAVGPMWARQIIEWGMEQGIDPDIIATFILVESGGNPLAHCPGDKLGYRGTADYQRDHGLFQLNPTYFKNTCDFDSNVRQGVAYIKSRLTAANGNLAAAAAGYNGGPMALKWFLTSSDANSPEYQRAKADYIVFLNNNGYDGAAKARIVEIYVSRITGVYSAAKGNSTRGLDPFLTPGSYAGSVAKAYGYSWPPNP